MLTKTRYVPTESAVQGMVLAEPVRDRLQRTLMPKNATLTEENVHQLRAHHIDFVGVFEPETRTPEQIALDAQEATLRVQAIFEKADLTDPFMAAFFNQVLMYRSSQ